jgi:hypothetical protein
MSDPASPPTPPLLAQMPNVHVFRSQEWRSIYANNTKIRATASDLSVTFARTLERPIGIGAVEELVEVTMTPKNLKQALLTLEETIKCYEEIFGEVTLEAAFRPNLENIRQSFNSLKTAIESVRPIQQPAQPEKTKSK